MKTKTKAKKETPLQKNFEPVKISESVKIPEPELENKAGIFGREGELVVDVFETNSEFVVLAAIAGIQIKDIDISLEKEMLVIRGNRQSPHLDIDKKYFFQECYWGPFSRKIVLPENINIAQAAAEMDKGVLTVKIPKTKQGNKEKIEVKVA